MPIWKPLLETFAHKYFNFRNMFNKNIKKLCKKPYLKTTSMLFQNNIWYFIGSLWSMDASASKQVKIHQAF